MPDKVLKNIQPRKYQQEIYESCKEKNCLVVLPTGIGKTLIALMLSVYTQKKYPATKTLFLAPTRPLAEQHLAYFKKHLPELFAELTLFTGKIDAEKRKELWQNSEIIFSTPQCIGNDIKNNLYDLSDVSLLIEDECHRCLKNYSYTYVAEKYKEQAKNPRILGLTASPGTDKATIQQVAKNLGIETIEIRTRESEDVKEYLQELEFEIIKLDFPDELRKITSLIRAMYIKKTEELKNRKLLYGPPTKFNILKLQSSIMSSILRGNKNFNMLSGASACAQAIKLSHLIELLETQTLYSSSNYIKSLFEQANQKKSKAVMHIVKNPDFNQAYIRLNELISKNIEHPKLSELKNIIQESIKQNPKNKSIVFSQYRDTGTRICKELNQIPNINAKVFVGQAKKTNDKGVVSGLNQKEQREIINEFKEGKINVIVATSVHPDEYIILKKNNKIMIKKIGEFVDSFIKENKKESMSKKISGWEVLSSNGKKSIFKPITDIHKHPAKDNSVKIKLSSGFDCFITEDHSLFSFDSDNLFTPSSPEKNKFIALSLRCPNIEQKKKIDIIKEVCENCSNEDLNSLFGSLYGLNQARIRIIKTDFHILSELEKDNLSIMDLSKLSKRDYSTVTDCLARLNKGNFITQKRVNKHYKNISKVTNKGKVYLKFLRWYFNDVKYKKGKYRFKLSNFSYNPAIFNEFFEQSINVNYGKTKFPRFIELNEYSARFLGFYVSEGYTRKTKLTSEVFLAARIKEMQDMMQESIEKGLNLKTRRNWRGIAIDSQIAFYLIKDVFKAGIGSYNKEVPELIFTAPSRIKWEFLKAYYLGDGYLGKDKIVLTTVSRKLVTGLVFLLRSLGIEKISIYKQKNIYRINIAESLPFAKIKNKNEKRRHAYYSLIPKAINSKKAFENYKNFYSYNPNISTKCRENGNWYRDICFDYINEIEKIEKPQFVYDLSVKGTENFVGGTGLICFHNSIAEEGLDIPEVNSVIFYEPIPSAIRKIQRAGRTARLMKGKLIILLTKDTLDEIFYYASRAKEKRMYSSLESIKNDLNNGISLYKDDKEAEIKEKQKKLF